MLMVDYRKEKVEANWSSGGHCSCSGQKGCWFGLAGNASYEMTEFGICSEEG